MNKNLIAVTLCCLTTVAFGGIGDFFKHAGQTAVKTVTAPTQTVINAVQVVAGNKPPSAILDPAKELGNAGGSAVVDGANLVGGAQNDVYRAAQSVASQAGAPGELVFDVATFSTRYEAQWHLAEAHAVGNALQGQNPLQFVGIPLAAAIREGRERHIANAKPLPDDVRKGLEGHYAPGVLDRARWTVGKLEITLPNGIGKTVAFGDGGYAVTVDDVIVFNQQPPDFRSGAEWWGHEVTHVEQYQQMGVDEFARRYVFSGGADLEDPAKQRGREVATAAQRAGLAAATASEFAVTTSAVNRPLLPAFALNYKVNATQPPLQVPPSPVTPIADPPIVQCVFPQDPRPFVYLGTQAGRIIVVDRISGQWMHIGYAMPTQMANVAWHYNVTGAFYDVLPDGRIFQRFTPYGPQQVGYVVRLQ